MSHRLFPSILALLVPAFVAPLFGQAPAASKNLIANGDFEQSRTVDDIWDGVDGDGYLAGGREKVSALAEKGMANVAMPVSIKMVDMNGDKAPDLVTADPIGYFRIYFNSGTPTEPKFTTGEILPLFLWSPKKYSTKFRHTNRGVSQNDLWRVPKIDLADWNGRGTNDLIIGLYSGEILVIPNSGSANNPLFKQPTKIESQIISTSVGGRTWGNLFAPIATDWNGDKNIDLLVGEGSYSANAVHIMLNGGSNSAPKFTDDNRFYFAYGMGREHLHPSLDDFNGDGKRDLLVSDRLGNISLYLNKSDKWKAGDELEFSSVVSLGGSASQKSLISLTTGDYNGDGKIDILVGKTNGRVGVALNTGTAQEPKFGPLTEIKGTDVHKRDLKIPSGWDISTGAESGNAFAVVTTVDKASDPQAEPPQGKSALKAYYRKPVNQVITPGIVEYPAAYSDGNQYYGMLNTAAITEYETTTRNISLYKRLPDLKVGQSYQLTFKYKGNGVRNAYFVVGYRGFVKLAEDKVTQKGRGVDVQKFQAAESPKVDGSFSPGSSWKEESKSFSVRFSERQLKDLKKAGYCKFFINFELTGWDSVLYLDDVQLVEK